MLRIKDNKVEKGYKGLWVSKEYKYIDNYDIKLSDNFEKTDITYEIDKILKDEGYNIDFHNCCMSGYDDVIYYDFGEKYSIELVEFENCKKYTLTFVLKEITTVDDLWELEYLRTIYKKIKKEIMCYTEKVEE